jgi:hypothetical protein
MPKKNFEGEGNPSTVPFEKIELPKIKTIDPNPIMKEGKHLELADSELAVLKVLLDRDRTSKIVHGGLKSILSLNDEQAWVLLNFLRRI